MTITSLEFSTDLAILCKPLTFIYKKWGVVLTLKNTSLFFLGEWQVNPGANTLCKGGLVKQLEPKAMDVLLLLCEQ